MKQLKNRIFSRLLAAMGMTLGAGLILFPLLLPTENYFRMVAQLFPMAAIIALLLFFPLHMLSIRFAKQIFTAKRPVGFSVEPAIPNVIDIPAPHEPQARPQKPARPAKPPRVRKPAAEKTDRPSLMQTLAKWLKPQPDLPAENPARDPLDVAIPAEPKPRKSFRELIASVTAAVKKPADSAEPADTADENTQSLLQKPAASVIKPLTVELPITEAPAEPVDAETPAAPTEAPAEDPAPAKKKTVKSAAKSKPADAPAAEDTAAEKQPDAPAEETAPAPRKRRRSAKRSESAKPAASAENAPETAENAPAAEKKEELPVP